MSPVFQRLLSQQRLIALTVFVLASIGAFAWRTMPRQEDPDLVPRWGSITVEYPGADAEAVERLVVEPIEDGLAEVESLRFTQARAAENAAVFVVVLADSVTADELDSTWKEVEDALDRARPEFPAGVEEPVLDRGLTDQEAIVLAVTGSHDPLALRDAAREMKERLLDLDEVSRIKLTGDPGDQIVVAYDPAIARKLGVSAPALVDQIRQRNAAVPGGAILSGARRAALAPETELRNLQDLAQTPVHLQSGSTVPLSEVAEVTRGPDEPVAERMHYQGLPAIGIGIVAEPGCNVVEFGAAVRAEVRRLRADYPGLRVDEVTFQPDRVERRIADLARSLSISMMIVAGVLFLFMGVRMGLVVVSVVPLVALSALAIYAVAGGILHQMSIAALVIALGMLVDNAIVVAEQVQRRIDDGMARADAAFSTVRELALPLLTATGTTIAAFVPMLLSEGAVGEFTRAIPTLITLTLLISFLYALLVTPLLSRAFLRVQRVSATSFGERLARRLGRATVSHHRVVLLVVLLALGSVASVGGQVKNAFFPEADRNQVLVRVSLPQGTDVEATTRTVQKLEAELLRQDDVESVAAFIGRSAPRFYYNVQYVPFTPHRGQLLLTTTSKASNDAVVAHVGAWAERHLPGVEVAAAALAQGPGMAAPVEIRLRGDNMQHLAEAAVRVRGVLAGIEGAVAVRDTLSLGSPTVRFDIDDAAAARHQVSRQDVALALLGHTRGYSAGQMRTGDEPVPIVVRAPAGDRTPAEELGGIVVTNRQGRMVPLEELVHVQHRWLPASYDRRDGKRVVYVRSNLASGVPSSVVFDAFRQQIAAAKLPASVSLTYGGDAEGSGDANTAMLATLPLGLLLLVGFLMVEFNSFRRVAIVLSTIPLAGVGVIPGLILGDQPFGFMSLLGVFALAGVVVNNAIVLLDVAERGRQGGLSTAEALVQAVAVRTRPILLTTLTTVAGLLPLALSSTSLWPPLAWAMISGLVASTGLTLLLVPALYRLLIRESPPRANQAVAERGAVSATGV
ncbi:MAG: efflux RND transporter permease subunit [Myxococcales bacterium FL481]|nr:MAG: efflux RND transporter permease subunit [Myxococcales bacterium FL481]